MPTQAQTAKGSAVAQDTVHSYHLVLANGSERDVRGVAVELHDGCLVIRNAQGTHVVTYAPGSWTLCEIERQDDRG